VKDNEIKAAEDNENEMEKRWFKKLRDKFKCLAIMHN
jgi:hypothetical protein